MGNIDSKCEGNTFEGLLAALKRTECVIGPHVSVGLTHPKRPPVWLFGGENNKMQFESNYKMKFNSDCKFLGSVLKDALSCEFWCDTKPHLFIGDVSVDGSQNCDDLPAPPPPMNPKDPEEWNNPNLSGATRKTGESEEVRKRRVVCELMTKCKGMVHWIKDLAYLSLYDTAPQPVNVITYKELSFRAALQMRAHCSKLEGIVVGHAETYSASSHDNLLYPDAATMADLLDHFTTLCKICAKERVSKDLYPHFLEAIKAEKKVLIEKEEDGAMPISQVIYEVHARIAACLLDALVVERMTGLETLAEYDKVLLIGFCGPEHVSRQAKMLKGLGYTIKHNWASTSRRAKFLDAPTGRLGPRDRSGDYDNQEDTYVLDHEPFTTRSRGTDHLIYTE
jgi:hypothetical protein